MYIQESARARWPALFDPLTRTILPVSAVSVSFLSFIHTASSSNRGSRCRSLIVVAACSLEPNLLAFDCRWKLLDLDFEHCRISEL
jgi:hypothetical protein